MTPDERLAAYRHGHRISAVRDHGGYRCRVDGLRIHVNRIGTYKHDQADLARLEDAAMDGSEFALKQTAVRALLDMRADQLDINVTRDHETVSLHVGEAVIRFAGDAEALHWLAGRPAERSPA